MAGQLGQAGDGTTKDNQDSYQQFPLLVDDILTAGCKYSITVIFSYIKLLLLCL